DRKLVVRIVAEDGHERMVSLKTIDSVVEEQKPETRERTKPFIALARTSLEGEATAIELNRPPETGRPAWSAELIPEEHQQTIHGSINEGQMVTLRVPVWVRRKDGHKTSPFFHVHLERDAKLSDAQIRFIREGILINDVRPRRTS